MKVVLILMIIVNSLILAADTKDDSKKSRTKKEVEKQIQKEKKYKKEQTFYQSKQYDLKGAEVNKDSLESIPEIEVDDFNMDSVYD